MRAKIFLDMENTTYIYHEESYGYDVTFYFASYKAHKKFNEAVKNEIAIKNEQFLHRYGFEADLSLLWMMCLYRRLERYGFLMKLNGVIYRCPQDVRLNGVTVTLNSYKEP